MIHVCFGLYDKTGRYSKFTGTTMLSIFENTRSEVTVHILHDNTLTPDNRDKFISLVKHYEQRVEFYNVDELCPDRIAEIMELVPHSKGSRLSIGAFYRLFIPQFLPANIDKCIYLDSDIVVNLDINELWQIDIGDKPLGAIPEIFASFVEHKINGPRKYLVKSGLVRYEDFFNSGVLIMNLNYLRNVEETIRDGIKWLGEHPQCSTLDQDMLNYLFSKDYVKLPVKFDIFVRDERLGKRHPQIEKAIYHYVLNCLKLDMKDPFNRLWMEYFMKTPWFDKDSIGRLYEIFEQNYRKTYFDSKSSIINVSAMVSGKTRAFFLTSENFNKLKKVFSIRDDEEVILTDCSERPVAELVISMWRAQGQKIFFIFAPNFPALSAILKKMEFVQNKDYLNGLEFLPTEQDLLFNSHSLIQAI